MKHATKTVMLGLIFLFGAHLVFASSSLSANKEFSELEFDKLLVKELVSKEALEALKPSSARVAKIDPIYLEPSKVEGHCKVEGHWGKRTQQNKDFECDAEDQARKNLARLKWLTGGSDRSVGGLLASNEYPEKRRRQLEAKWALQDKFQKKN